MNFLLGLYEYKAMILKKIRHFACYVSQKKVKRKSENKPVFGLPFYFAGEKEIIHQYPHFTQLYAQVWKNISLARFSFIKSGHTTDVVRIGKAMGVKQLGGLFAASAALTIN